MLSYVTAIYQSNLCKCQLSSQLYVSCILRLHSSKCLCKANLSWINQEISWCMLYVEQGILFRSQEGSARFAKMNKSPVCTLTPPHFITLANISYTQSPLCIRDCWWPCICKAVVWSLEARVACKAEGKLLWCLWLLCPTTVLKKEGKKKRSKQKLHLFLTGRDLEHVPFPQG